MLDKAQTLGIAILDEAGLQALLAAGLIYIMVCRFCERSAMWSAACRR